MTHAINVVPRSARIVPILAQPVSLDFHLETTLDDRVARELSQRALRELINLYMCQQSIPTPLTDPFNSREPPRCTLPTEVPRDTPIRF